MQHSKECLALDVRNYGPESAVLEEAAEVEAAVVVVVVALTEEVVVAAAMVEMLEMAIEMVAGTAMFLSEDVVLSKCAVCLCMCARSFCMQPPCSCDDHTMPLQTAQESRI